jgi:uncharacterized protein
MQLLSVKNLYRQDVGATEKFDIAEDGKSFDFPEAIVVSEIRGKVTAFRLEDTVAVSGEYTADITLICDRCLDNFDTTVTFSFEREYTLDRKGESEEGLYVDKRGDVDLTGPIHDELLLAIPTQNFCNTDCQGICQGCGHNLNHEKCKCKDRAETTN